MCRELGGEMATARAVALAMLWAVAGSVASAQEAQLIFQPQWALSSTTETTYSSFSGSRGYPFSAAPQFTPFPGLFRGSGNQVYLENSYALSGKPSEDMRFDFVLKGGYVRAEQTTPSFYGRVSTATDTVFSATATYLGLDGIQPYLSLNVSLPTGKSALYGFGGRARLDPDLVSVPTYGEGVSVGPILGVTIPVTQELVLGLSGGVTWKEAYYREGLVPIGFPQIVPFQAASKFRPGLGASVSSSITYAEGAFSAQGSASYSTETTTYIDNVATARNGNRFSLSLFTSYALTDTFAISFNGSASFATPNKSVPGDFVSPFAIPPFAPAPTVIFISNGVLFQEQRNGNNRVYQGRLTGTYLLTPEFKIAPFVSVLSRDQNSYDAVSTQFVPAKVRLGIGATAAYTFSEHVTFTGRVEHIRTKERGTATKFDPLVAAFFPNAAFLPGSSTPPLSYYGWQVAGGVTFSF